MNRITQAIKWMDERIKTRLESKQTTSEQITKLHKTLDLELIEFCKFQELKSLALANGKLTLEEATTVYNYLGKIPDTFNNQSVSIKSVLNHLFLELIEERLK